MKSKSIVQERLDAGKNRLEILVREVEAARMPIPELTRGLRQVGVYLESIQKMVKSDADMKFAQQINQRLDAGANRLSDVIRKLEGSGITGNDLNTNLTQVSRTLDSVQEFVDLEIETLA